YSHCAQYLHRVAKAHYGASVQALEWVEATMTRLYLGKVGLVLGGLQRMQAQSDEAAKAIANCWAYLDEHRGRTHYRKLREHSVILTLPVVSVDSAQTPDPKCRYTWHNAALTCGYCSPHTTKPPSASTGHDR